MSKAPARNQPSVEELLASIREAIYEDGPESGGAGMSATRQAAVESRDTTGEAAGEVRAPAAPAPVRHEPSHAADYNGAGVAAPHGSMRGLRVSLDRDSTGPGRVSARTDDFLHLRERLTTLMEDDGPVRPGKTMVTSSREGFSGILGGDVRLEEALARLSRAGRPPSSHELSRSPEPPPAASPRAAPAPAEPPRAAPDAPRRPRLDSAAVEELAGHTLRPAIREAVDAELRALPQETAAPPPEMPQGPPRPSWQHGYSRAAEAEHEDTPPETWEAAPPPETRSRPASGPAPAAEGPVRPAAPERPAPPPDTASAGSERYRRQATPDPAPASRSPAMLAPESAEQAASAFDRLAETIMAQATAGERSVEDLVRELLRPMLKAWLDHNLPKLVERLVRDEIERVARHSRG